MMSYTGKDTLYTKNTSLDWNLQCNKIPLLRVRFFSFFTLCRYIQEYVHVANVETPFFLNIYKHIIFVEAVDPHYPQSHQSATQAIMYTQNFRQHVTQF